MRIIEQMQSLPDKVRRALESNDRVAEIAAWARDVVAVDRAMEWGYAWGTGPFKTSDEAYNGMHIGSRKAAQQLQAKNASKDS